MENTSARQPTEVERARFVAKTRPTDNGCVEWIGARIAAGYGYFVFDGRMWRVHRLAWAWERGAIGDGLTIDHLCKNRACVNVEHMEIVTRGENALRGSSAPAVNAGKRTCIRGHDDWATVGVRGGRTYRYCRICRRDWQHMRDRAKGIQPKGSKTTCVHGHEFTPENTYRSRDGWRRCRTCNRERARKPGTVPRGPYKLR